jgi:hypothetical protein
MNSLCGHYRSEATVITKARENAVLRSLQLHSTFAMLVNGVLKTGEFGSQDAKPWTPMFFSHGRPCSLLTIQPRSSKLLVAGPIPVSRSRKSSAYKHPVSVLYHSYSLFNLSGANLSVKRC